MSTKKISINPDFFNLTKSKSKSKRKSRKQKPDFSTVKPNSIKQKLIQKVKQHKNNELQKLKEENENKNIDNNNEFNDDFKNSIDYLQSLSKKHQQKKLEKKKRRMERKNKTLKKNSIPDPPPYGILKNGKKPTYSQYRASLKNRDNIVSTSLNEPIISDNNNIPVITDSFYQRKNTLLDVKSEFNKEKKNTHKVKVKEKHTKTKKIIHLGKKGGNVGILIKNKKTRKKIKKEINTLKNKSLVNVKKYLKKHNLIKIGTAAPENMLRSMYENSYLAGDIYNKNKDILVHNFTQE